VQFTLATADNTFIAIQPQQRIGRTIWTTRESETRCVYSTEPARTPVTMTRDLDDWIAELAAAPPDHSLVGLEASVSGAIAARRGEARMLRALAPVRLATLGVALAMGVTAGGAATRAAIRTPSPSGAFAAATQLAPSTLLDGAE
jgi:hypothetical protein